MKQTDFKTAPLARTAHRIRSGLNGQSLALVGLMGAGKSTIGKRIATILDMPFFDADIEIEKAAQMTITEIFERYGESEFRDLERRVIVRLMQEGPMVLATGGGAYMNEETRTTIGQKAIAVWLNAELDVLVARVLRRNTRPLLHNKDPKVVLQKLIDERYPIYALADINVKSHDKRRDVIARDVVRHIDRYLNENNRYTDDIKPSAIKKARRK